MSFIIGANTKFDSSTNLTEVHPYYTDPDNKIKHLVVEYWHPTRRRWVSWDERYGIIRKLEPSIITIPGNVKVRVFAVDRDGNNSEPTTIMSHPKSTELSKVSFNDLDEELKTKVNTVAGGALYKVEIVSSHGLYLRKSDNPSDVLTTLTAKVYQGAVDITDSVDANRFKWTRVSPPPYNAQDVTWNAEHFGGTKTIDITNHDISIRATFTCEILDS